jgi:SNF2 family DNA or RNA helicase
MVAELGQGDILTAPSPLTKMTRLIQFSSSYAELEPFTDPKTGKEDVKVRLTEPSSKVDAFMADLPDFGDDSVVVFAQSRQLIYLLHDRLEKEGIPHGLITGMQNEDERQKSIDDFQAGKTKFILATMGAGGTGLTLTAARIAVYLQRSWSLIENEQSEGRVHRIGSEIHDSILYIDYVTADSVEELQHMAVAAKFARLEEILRDKDLMKRALMDNQVMDYLSQDLHDSAHNDGATEGLR